MVVSAGLKPQSRRATDSVQNICLMTRMENTLTPIKIKTWESLKISGCLEARVGGKEVHIGTSNHIRYRVCCQGNRTVVNWDFYQLEGSVNLG